MSTSSIGPPAPGEKLQALLDSGVAYISDHGNYLARASDGVEIAISGPLMDEAAVARIEDYLNDHPTPADW